MKAIITTKYVAEDGRSFDTQEECLKHERNIIFDGTKLELGVYRNIDAPQNYIMVFRDGIKLHACPKGTVGVAIDGWFVKGEKYLKISNVPYAFLSFNPPSIK